MLFEQQHRPLSVWICKIRELEFHALTAFAARPATISIALAGVAGAHRAAAHVRSAVRDALP